MKYRLMLGPLAKVKSPASSAKTKYRAMAKKPDDQYSEKEIKQRFEAALRGARIAGHKPMSEVSPKRPAKKKRASKHD
jgi:hypothetical protein